MESVKGEICGVIRGLNELCAAQLVGLAEFINTAHPPVGFEPFCEAGKQQEASQNMSSSNMESAAAAGENGERGADGENALPLSGKRAVRFRPCIDLHEGKVRALANLDTEQQCTVHAVVAWHHIVKIIQPHSHVLDPIQSESKSRTRQSCARCWNTPVILIQTQVIHTGSTDSSFLPQTP